MNTYNISNYDRKKRENRNWLLFFLLSLQLGVSDLRGLPLLEGVLLPEESFTYLTRPRVIGMVFLLFLIVYFSSSQSSSLLFGNGEEGQEDSGDLEVEFRPYEQEVRQFLRKHDWAMLHKVDSLLRKYEGQEEILMDKLRNKYEKPTKSAVNPDSNATLSAGVKENETVIQSEEIVYAKTSELDENYSEEMNESEFKDFLYDYAEECSNAGSDGYNEEQYIAESVSFSEGMGRNRTPELQSPPTYAAGTAFRHARHQRLSGQPLSSLASDPLHGYNAQTIPVDSYNSAPMEYYHDEYRHDWSQPQSPYEAQMNERVNEGVRLAREQLRSMREGRGRLSRTLGIQR